ncbi:hypothetical protein O6H91_04G030400 [Diphasiastrum complanatum]|uniref:Uncharacterized protein n=1 Tax=Diphasiastrum complanatum TaxID=34168 RepID=A0ACC2DVR6_DIPCM|nr:hypothetical protein O6H91_04G030400 [Diphasiastrum complanatum]
MATDDVPAAPSNPTAAGALHCKRYNLSNTIQASFGKPGDPDYVFSIAANGDKSRMAVSLSTHAIKTYSPFSGQFVGECLGHSSTISEIAFPDSSSPHMLCSSSADGTIRAWDIRTHKQVLCWDWRTKQQLACLEDCHTEDVTQVRFHPVRKEKLISASVDGLMCTFDTKGDINDEDGMESVSSVGTSIAKVGFYGPSFERLWCLTHIETLSIWNFEDATLEADFGDTRTKASMNWSLSPVNYNIDCLYLPAAESLWLVAGTLEGSIGYFPVQYSGNSSNTYSSAGAIGPVSSVLEGGHSAVVRAVWSPLEAGLAAQQDLFCWTGGEDGRLCSWSKEQTAVNSNAWVSSRLVFKRDKRMKQRHSPY